MGMPQLTGSLQGLKALDADDLARYMAAVENGQQMGWRYYFPYLLSQHREGTRADLLVEDEGSMCVFRWQIRDSTPRLDVFVAPTPMNVPVLKRCIERANEFNDDRSARVMRIDAGDVDAVSAAGIRVNPRESQYIYPPGEYDSLGGKKYYTIRRNVALVERLPDVQVMPYAPSHAKACRELLKRWGKAHREVHGTSGGISLSKRAIDLAGVLPKNVLRGEVVFIDGHLAAFAFGGEIRPGLACSFERKCDTEIRGLSYFQLHSLLRNLQDFSLVNDGSDAGRAGLRQLKESLRPVAMHEEYRGIQRKQRRTIVSGARIRKSASSPIESLNSPILSGALTGLKVLEVDHLVRYQAALEAGAQMGWAYYFPYLLTRKQPGRRCTLFVEDENSVCIFLWQVIDSKPRIDLYLSPAPVNISVLKRCIERMNEFNADYSARIMRVDAKDTEAVAGAGIRVKERKKQYIFAPSNYDHLGGKKYYTIRRNVTLIERLADVEVMPYSLTHADACRKLLERWGKVHRRKYGAAGGIGTSRRTIDLAGTLPDSVLRGEVVYISGRLVAFAFGGQIRPGLACSFERKCDTEVRGLSYFQLRSFLSGLQEFTLVNDGSDAGLTGLRQLKDSFRPINMHIEYRGHQSRSKL